MNDWAIFPGKRIIKESHVRPCYDIKLQNTSRSGIVFQCGLTWLEIAQCQTSFSLGPLQPRLVCGKLLWKETEGALSDLIDWHYIYCDISIVNVGNFYFFLVKGDGWRRISILLTFLVKRLQLQTSQSSRASHANHRESLCIRIFLFYWTFACLGSWFEIEM